MDFDTFRDSVAVEIKRFDDFRTDALAHPEDETITRSMIGEFNSHVRRMDSLWRQFADDHKRAVGAGIVPPGR